MRERPILFSGEMVRAILDGRKTMTRRVMKPQPGANKDMSYGKFWWKGAHGWDEQQMVYHCPYGAPGDRLWVREKFRLFNAREECSHYESCDCMKYHNTPMYFADSVDNESKWRPSIHMPRSASRINLEITDIRVERLQEISVEDVIAEGVNVMGRLPMPGMCKSYNMNELVKTIACNMFKELWDSINAKRGYGWDANPWVWVIGFRRAA